MTVIINNNDTIEQVITKINDEINTRRNYGIRQEELPTVQKSFKLTWSNAGEEWYTTPIDEELKCSVEQGNKTCKYVKSKTQRLDANQIVVTGVPKKVLDGITPLLNKLPLYSGSFEARQRGEFSLKNIEIPPGLKQAWLDSITKGEPLDIQSQKAIEEKRKES